MQADSGFFEHLGDELSPRTNDDVVLDVEPVRLLLPGDKQDRLLTSFRLVKGLSPQE